MALNNSDSCNEFTGEVTAQRIIDVCSARNSLSPIKADPHFWATVQCELLAALVDIQNADACISKAEDTCSEDLVVLEAMATAMIHLGLAMALVLCPPLIDPLTMSATEYYFLDAIVSFNIVAYVQCEAIVHCIRARVLQHSHKHGMTTM